MSDLSTAAIGDTMTGDTTTSAIYAALQGLTARRNAIADNVANINTPGYSAKQVGFEASLDQALAAGDPSTMAVSVTSSPAAAKANGNNVDLATETVDAQKTNLAYQAMNAKMQLLSTAISGQPTGA